MKITIVTLNYNGSEETLKLLRSLKEQANQDFEIIVVDNASEEADFAKLQEVIHKTTSQVVYPQGSTVLYPPQVKVIRNSQNLGFSGGNNVGIRQALGWNMDTDPAEPPRKGDSGASWVVLLNNDTWVERGFVDRLRAVLTAKNGVVGIPLVEGDRTAYAGKIGWLKPTLKHIYQNPTYYILHTTYCYAIGAAMAIHKDVFDKIGFLDEKYFLYFEDADFSVRARKAQIPICIKYDIMIYHTISASTKKLGSPLLLRYHYRNALYFNRKNGPWYIKLLVWPWSLIIVIKQLGKLAINRDKKESDAILTGIVDFYKNRMGKIK
ncbi:MAG: glycosyltransferase family 2 protein [Candidatus Yanofskybacteria bacterium]|nr:glycosyltransferase family 2 protein [Candidatus Yanofskybacteria bacterium]